MFWYWFGDHLDRITHPSHPVTHSSQASHLNHHQYIHQATNHLRAYSKLERKVELYLITLNLLIGPVDMYLHFPFFFFSINQPTKPPSYWFLIGLILILIRDRFMTWVFGFFFLKISIECFWIAVFFFSFTIFDIWSTFDWNWIGLHR